MLQPTCTTRPAHASRASRIKQLATTVVDEGEPESAPSAGWWWVKSAGRVAIMGDRSSSANGGIDVRRVQHVCQILDYVTALSRTVTFFGYLREEVLGDDVGAIEGQVGPAIRRLRERLEVWAKVGG